MCQVKLPYDPMAVTILRRVAPEARWDAARRHWTMSRISASRVATELKCNGLFRVFHGMSLDDAPAFRHDGGTVRTPEQIAAGSFGRRQLELT